MGDADAEALDDVTEFLGADVFARLGQVAQEHRVMISLTIYPHDGADEDADGVDDSV